MRAKNFGIFLLLLFGFVFLGMIGDLFDEERRQLFDLWLIALAMIAAALGAGVFYFRRSGQPRAADSAPAPERVETVQPRSTKPPIALVTLSALLILSVSWIVLVYTGAPDRHDEAFANLQMITAVITAAAASLLSVWGPTAHRSSVLKLRLAAIGLVVPAFVGIFVVPLLALRYWFGFMDFEKYVPKIAGAWFYLTLAGVLLCLLRTRRGKGSPH